MFNQLLENTILLFVAVDPIALVPIFASLTQGVNKDDIKKIYIQATLVSFFVLSLFYLFGTCVIGYHGYLNEFI
jgi:multiple antibiotic resistance protein